MGPQSVVMFLASFYRGGWAGSPHRYGQNKIQSATGTTGMINMIYSLKAIQGKSATFVMYIWWLGLLEYDLSYHRTIKLHIYS